MGTKTLGNHALAYLLTKGEVMTTGTLTVGSWYYVKAKATAASTLPVDIGLPFPAATALVLAEGDKVLPLTKKMLGFARGKNLSNSKNVQDSTTDSDEGQQSNLSDGVIATSGSISGYNEIPAANSAQLDIIAMFAPVLSDVAGTISVKEVTTPVCLLMLDWTARRLKASGPSAGDVAEIDILPVIFTSKNTDSDHGSVKGFNCDFTATASDDDGCKKAHYIGTYYFPSTP